MLTEVNCATLSMTKRTKGAAHCVASFQDVWQDSKKYLLTNCTSCVDVLLFRRPPVLFDDATRNRPVDGPCGRGSDAHSE